MTKPVANFPLLLAKGAMCIILLPLIVAVGVAVVVISLAFSPFSAGRNGSSFISKVASETFSFFLTGKLFGPKQQVAVRDVRLRDPSGSEHLVRIEGELRSGNLTVGDEVQVEGVDHHGTLMFRRGWNKRICSEIIVKRK